MSDGKSVEDTRTGMSAEALRQAIEDHLRYTLGRPAALLEPKHYYHALALAVRDRMQDRWAATTQTYVDLSRKVTAYLSAEFLLGPHLGNNLLNLQIEEEARTALAACAAVFAKKACKALGTSAAGIEINCKPFAGPGGPLTLAKFKTEVRFPEGFTAEQKAAVLDSIVHCAVKEVVADGPNIEFLVEEV